MCEYGAGAFACDINLHAGRGLTMRGGTLGGLPVIVSDHVPVGTVIMVNAQDVFLADDGLVTIDASREASLEMADNPAHNSGTPTGATATSGPTRWSAGCSRLCRPR